MNIVRSIRGLALVGLASLGLTTTASAQNAVDVDIVVGSGGIAILNYYSSMDVSIDPAQLAALATTCTITSGEAECDELDGGVVAATENGGELDADFTMPILVGGAANLTAVALNLDDVWAVRSLGGGATTTVTVGAGAGLSLSNGTDTIAVGNAPLIYSDTDTTPGATAVFNDPGLGAATAEHGGVQLQLDLSGVATAGTYSAAGSTYTIEVTSN